MASWVKGQSGNPGGRPKALRQVVELARQRTAKAIKTLEEIMLHGENEGARVRAAEILIERGWGKATQPISGAGEDTGGVSEIAIRLIRPNDGT